MRRPMPLIGLRRIRRTRSALRVAAPWALFVVLFNLLLVVSRSQGAKCTRNGKRLSVPHRPKLPRSIKESFIFPITPDRSAVSSCLSWDT